MNYLILFFTALILTSCQGQNQQIILSHNAQKGNTVKVDGKEWKDPMFKYEGQLCQHIRGIYQDKSGDLWFGTNVYGLMHFDGDTLVYYDEKHGLGGGRINGIVEDDQGNIWFGTYSGLSKYDGQKFKTFTAEDGLIHDYVTSYIIDKEGVFWVGTLEGLSKFDGNSFSDFPIPQVSVQDTTSRLSYKMIPSIMQDNKGNIWIGTDGFGLWKYDGSEFEHFTTEQGLCDNNVTALFEDRKGQIWIATMFGGLSIYNGSEFFNPTQEGIINGIELSGFFEDPEGSIWFGVENNGVYKYDGSNFSNLLEKHDLPTNGINCIYKDRQERFWFGGWLGLFRLMEDEFVPITKEGPWD